MRFEWEFAELKSKTAICPSDEMVDLSDSKSDAERRAGSSPALGTIDIDRRFAAGLPQSKP